MRRLFWLLLLLPCLARAEDLQVLYAGSLTTVMERALGPAFTRATGIVVLGKPGGSIALAQDIAANLTPADLFLSASPAADRALMPPAGHALTWFIRFARSPLVIGYDPHSRFAGLFARRPWYSVLQTPGLRLGRTDPALDPKGRLTLTLMHKAEIFYHQPGLAARILGTDGNPAQIRPEEALVGALEAGELDAGIFYATETAPLHLPSVSLPAPVGADAIYTIAIPATARHPDAALAFVRFLFGPAGRAILQSHGLTPLPLAAVGDRAAIPAALRAGLVPAAGSVPPK